MQFRFKKRFALVVCAAAANSAQGGLIFNFTSAAGSQTSYNEILPAFQAAADRWSSLVTDDIQVNIALGYVNLGDSLISSTAVESAPFYYSDFLIALLNDAQSADDASVYQHLQKIEITGGQAFNLLLNRALPDAGGISSATPYLDDDGDDNNQFINLPLANAKALGFAVDPDYFPIDATITLNNATAWDINPEDGIDSDKFDQVGIATRELGRALGFISGVDVLDTYSPPYTPAYRDDQFTFVTPLDLLRFSADSVAYGDGVIDWTADDRTKYLSLDGGATPLAELSTGVHFGDGNPAGNWKAGQDIGVMDPAPSPGQELDITIFDLRAIDAIGYNTVPEPSTFTLILAAGLLGTFRHRNRRQS